MNIKTLLTFGIFTVVTAAVIVPGVSAYRGDPSVTGPNYTEQRHEAMETAFANNDFAAWQELMAGRGRVSQVITQENFAQFAKAHQLAEAGQVQEAAQIRQELGLGLQNGTGCNLGMGRNWSR